MAAVKRAFCFAIDHYLALPLGVVAALVWVERARGKLLRFAHASSFTVNDIGMALFLAVMTKEVVEALSHGGALHSWRRRSLAIVAAAGGMLGAALTYLAYLQMGDELSVLGPGWPIPCAIDLAFSYFIAKAIFGRHSVVSFVLLLAIVTDAIEVLIVALRVPGGRRARQRRDSHGRGNPRGDRLSQIARQTSVAVSCDSGRAVLGGVLLGRAPSGVCSGAHRAVPASFAPSSAFPRRAAARGA